MSRSWLVTCACVVGSLTIAACGAAARSAAPDESAGAFTASASASAVTSSPTVSPLGPSTVASTAIPSVSASSSPSEDEVAPAQASSRVPPAPTIDSVTTGNGSISVTAHGPSDAGVISQYFVTAVPQTGGTEFTTQWPCRPWEMPCTITGLTPGDSYVVRVAAYNAYGAGTPAEGGTWVASAPKPTPPPAPAAYAQLLDGQVPGCGGIFMRAVSMSITNWVDDEMYVKLMREMRPFAIKGRIPPSGRATVCSYPLLGQNSAYAYNDIGFGQAPVERDGPSGSSNYQFIDLRNPFIGKPSVAMSIIDTTGANKSLVLEGYEGEGKAMAWADKYFFLTRNNDDSCGDEKICWSLVISRLPNGVQNGMTWQWGGGRETVGPDPLPRP
ncbi:MAG: fibronectin type III domain-containing protein [Actinomycetales bacterium]|nr:fibronectin type III domain-containing protein [Actinomycetales bacterium]